MTADIESNRMNVVAVGSIDVTAAGLDVALIDYSGDDYPRAGCTIVVDLIDGAYSMRVYSPGAFPAPGFVAGAEQARLLESYAPRPLASLGIAIDTFAQGLLVQAALTAMRRAEHGAERLSTPKPDPG